MVHCPSFKELSLPFPNVYCTLCTDCQFLEKTGDCNFSYFNTIVSKRSQSVTQVMSVTQCIERTWWNWNALEGRKCLLISFISSSNRTPGNSTKLYGLVPPCGVTPYPSMYPSDGKYRHPFRVIEKSYSSHMLSQPAHNMNRSPKKKPSWHFT